MRFLQYKDLDLRRVRAAFDKVKAAIEADDFRTADVKKLHAGPYYRARLDHANRLLLQFARIDGQMVCLALEVILNHAYDHSRFLRGAAVDEAKIEHEPPAEPAAVPDAEPAPLRWLHPQRAQFELLDKPVVFDDAQDALARLSLPLVVAGSAGSGKTALTISRLRELPGRVLYVTLSPYLAQGALSLYGAHGFENPAQEANFLSFRELLETMRVPPGREVDLRAFRGWFDRHRQAVRSMGDIDAHALFEEFRGVIGAQPGGPLALADYLALGPRQSLLPPAAREAAHGLFQRYRQWLAEAGLFDANLVAHEWRSLAAAEYDFVVVDEVQDFTPVQLALVLATLKTPGQFLLCGDSNQIVHPNFFSWAAVKTMFWHGLAGAAAQRQQLHVLQANFRNTRRVTELANRLLKVKQSRFGSVDRESNFLVESTSGEEGDVSLVPARDAALKALDGATRASVQHAVIVLRDEDKAAAREHLRTPLLFSVHEAKGLEYPHVVLFNLVSDQRAAYAEVCEGVSAADVQRETLEYARARDKSDRSLEVYKFYVNALYVAMTRAVRSLTLVESDTGHVLLDLLGLQPGETQLQPTRASSKDEWAQEARKLELQGKAEQAQAIREAFLQSRPVPWTPWDQVHIEQLAVKALDPKNPSTKLRQVIFDYALWHGQQRWIERLAAANFAPVRGFVDMGAFVGAGWRDDRFERPLWDSQQALVRRTVAALRQRYLQLYAGKNFKDVLRAADAHGVDHRTPVGATPLMMAARAGNAPLVQALLDKGSHPESHDEFGHTAWLQAVSRAMDEPAFRPSLPALFELLAPQAIDVQTDGRLVRLERQQGEYWVLTLMLAGLKTQWSICAQRPLENWKYHKGFFAEQLHDVLEALPPHLWADQRRKRSYVSQVLSRAEVNSPYRPARKLWCRAQHGHYLPSPALLLRRGEGWQPVYEALNLSWINEGCSRESMYWTPPAELVARLARDTAPAQEASAAE